MFPCCGRVCCPCLSYSHLSDSDNEEELQEVTVSGGSSDSDDELTSEAVAYTNSAYRGVFNNREAVGLTSVGYSLLRACDYIQLHIIQQGLSSRQGSLNRERRSALFHDVNSSSIVPLDARVPQWIYPCGITPNGTFPNGRRPFMILNTSDNRHYEQLLYVDYGYYFRGGFDEWSHSWVGWLSYPMSLLTTRDLRDQRLTFPYGLTGTGDMILRHPRNITSQYPYARYGISNNLTDHGVCPVRIFNSTHFFGGGYIGLEEPGFEPIYPCGIHPDGLFTGEWLDFPNGTIPANAYPFGYFPNGSFPYVDYFFNPQFNHSALYLAVQNNQTEALQNYTRFLNPNETRLQYHPIPRNPNEPFAHCYGIFPSRGGGSSRYASNGGVNLRDIDRNLIRAGLWGAQFGAELGMVLVQDSSYAERRVVQAFYLGIRTANVIHSLVDLTTNIGHIMEHGPTNGEGGLAIHNMLTLTDILSLTNESIYFCTPTVQRIQQRLSQGTAANYLRSTFSSLRGMGQVVRGALNRLTAITGAMGVACTAGLGAALTVQMMNEDEHALSEQRVILGAQTAIAAVATVALVWITRANLARANRETQ